MALLGPINRSCFDNLYPYFVAYLQALVPPKDVLHRRTDETADSQIHFLPSVAHNEVNHRVQDTIVANASHAQALAVKVNLECMHRAGHRNML